MDNEIESRKAGSHRAHDKTREGRSVDRNNHHSPRNSSRREHSSSSPSLVRNHKNRYVVDELQGEINKIKPPTFYGEHKKDEDAKTFLLGMRKYIQLHNYYSHVEGIIQIYHIKGKTSMWWDQFVQVQHIDEKQITSMDFKRDFQNKYLTKSYHDMKMKEFFELKLGSMSIYEYERRFLEMLNYISLMKGE
jgi:hypothetical protein